MPSRHVQVTRVCGFFHGGGEIPVNTQQTLTRSSERTSADATVDRAAARI